MDKLLRRLARAGLRRGMAGEHWAWFALAVFAFLLRHACTERDESVSLTLRPGERYMIAMSPAEARGGHRSRGRLRRAAASAHADIGAAAAIDAQT